MKALAILLCSVIAIRAATFDLGWVESTSPGVGGYWIWVGSSNAATRLQSVAKTNHVNVTLPDGSYRITMTATNIVEEGGNESVKSAPLYLSILGTSVVVITGVPLAPTGLNLR